MRDFNPFAKFEITVDKCSAVLAKEPEYRKRYLELMDTLRVNLPPEDEEVVPHKNAEKLFRMARRIREGVVDLDDATLDPAAVADATDKHAIWEKTKIRVRRQLRAMDEERARNFEMLIWEFYDNGIEIMHHLKRLAKIENNPNGYYSEQYRRISRAYRKTQRALSSPKIRKIVAISRAQFPPPSTGGSADPGAG
jgi:hypothetical protein